MASKNNKKANRKNRSNSENQYGFIGKVADEWRDRAPILKFCFGFLFMTILLYAFTTTDFFGVIRKPMLEAYASVSSFILNIFGMGTRSSGQSILSPAFSVNIKAGCDAIAPMILYSLAVLAFPMQWSYKIKGLFAGLGFLTVLNLVRVISLYLIGRFARDFFDIMHVEVWQIIFIVLTVFAWLYWYNWATKKSLSNA